MKSKVTKITNKEIAKYTGYSPNYLKNIGKEKATSLLRKATEETLLKDKLRMNILEGLTYFSDNLKSISFDNIDDTMKLQAYLKFLEIILKEFNNKK